MHTLLDYEGNLPAYMYVSDGKTADNKAAYDVPLVKGSVIVADRYYNDFSLLNVWDSNEVYFVVRHKENLTYRSIEENPLPTQRHQDILIDEWIQLTGQQSAPKYKGKLRRVTVWDEENEQTIELLTNHPRWAGSTIGKLYKSRWQVAPNGRGSGD